MRAYRRTEGAAADRAAHSAHTPPSLAVEEEAAPLFPVEDAAEPVEEAAAGLAETVNSLGVGTTN